MPLPVCNSCGASEFRTSHLRTSDLGKLLTLRYPIRCLVCKERGFAFMGVAFSLGRRVKKKTRVIAQNGHA